MTLFRPSWLPFSNIVDKINKINPDIVHLHWVCGAMISIKDISKIKAPIVWSLHDMWAFTGGCHYDEFCGEFENSCSNCKVLGDDGCSLSRKQLLTKKNVYESLTQLNLVPTSKWIGGEVMKSFASKFVKPIMYNPLDTTLFKKISKNIKMQGYAIDLQ